MDMLSVLAHDSAEPLSDRAAYMEWWLDIHYFIETDVW
jgi:hypothetical protein